MFQKGSKHAVQLILVQNEFLELGGLGLLIFGIILGGLDFFVGWDLALTGIVFFELENHIQFGNICFHEL